MRLENKLSYVATRYGSALAFGFLAFAAVWLVPAGKAGADDNRPIIVKDSVQVTAFTFNSYEHGGKTA
jgi:hypothetical protein